MKKRFSSVLQAYAWLALYYTPNESYKVNHSLKAVAISAQLDDIGTILSMMLIYGSVWYDVIWLPKT